MKKLSILIAFFLIPSVTLAVAPNDYVSCWDLDETSGTRFDANLTNTNDLTDNNTVTSQTGILGNAASNTLANNEYLNITDANQVGLDITGDISFSFWIKPQNHLTTSYGYIYAKFAGGGSSYAAGYVDDGSGVKSIRVTYYDDGSPTTNVTAIFNQTLNNNTWYHVAIRSDVQAVNTVSEVFVNGTSIGSSTHAGVNVINNSAADFYLGHYFPADSGGAFNGQTDIFEIYNRLLTNAEISELYNSGSGASCTNRTASGGATAQPNGGILWY